MPPFLYPINHSPPQSKIKKYTMNENNEECIPLKPISQKKIQRNIHHDFLRYLQRQQRFQPINNNFPIDISEFYIPKNEYFTSCLSNRLISKEFADEKEEEEKLNLLFKKKKNKRDEFIFV